MADEATPDRAKIVGEIVDQIMLATEGKTVGDTQMAIANLVCRMASSANPDDPDRIVFLTLEIISEVWRAYRDRSGKGTPPPVISHNDLH